MSNRRHRNHPKKASDREVIERWVQHVDELFAQLRLQFPEIDPHDLHLILLELYRPPQLPRKIFLRKIGKSTYVW